MDNIKLIHGDCVEVMRGMEPESVDAIVCDPPYGLEFMGKDFDKLGKGRAQQAWHLRWCVQAFRVLKPGGHLLAFGGSRTSHHLACAIEDAKFEVRDSIIWLYGSGFPKSLNVGKSMAVTAPATEDAEKWEGWGTALKPAHDPVVVARKPLGEKTVATNVIKHGTGALNIDACRVSTTDTLGGGRLNGPTGMDRTCGGPEWNRPWMNDPLKKEAYAKATAEKVAKAEAQGRWPANVIHDGSKEVESLFPDGAARFFYCAKPSKKEREAGVEHLAKDGKRGNTHPTVKSVALMRHLVRLVTRPGGLVLDPFAGSGTTGVACQQEGFDCLLIEQESEYLPIMQGRVGTKQISPASFSPKGEGWFNIDLRGLKPTSTESQD